MYFYIMSLSKFMNNFSYLIILYCKCIHKHVYKYYSKNLMMNSCLQYREIFPVTVEQSHFFRSYRKCFIPVVPTDIAQYRLLFGFFLLYTDRVPF
jgi:hypothetical protein